METTRIPGQVDEILQLLPETRQVFMVPGFRTARRILAASTRAGVQAIWRSVDVHLVGRSVFCRRSAAVCASLPIHSVILLASRSAPTLQGGAYADERVFAELRATANAPLFGQQRVPGGGSSADR